jgi:hypothetical protein
MVLNHTQTEHGKRTLDEQGEKIQVVHEVRHARSRSREREREERTLTLICGSVYHVKNSTCIQLRTKGPNIYMYKRGRIYKEPLEKYNNKKG